MVSNLMVKIKNTLTHPPLLLLAAASLGLFLLALNVPLWGNMLLGLGSLVQADYIADFPENLSKTEYLRGYVYKFILYGILKTTDMLVAWHEYYSYQQMAKLLYYVLCFGLSFVFIRFTLTHKTQSDHLRLWASFWLLLFLGNYRQFMESEELAIVFALGHFLCIYSTSRKAHYFSGVFVFLLFGCKTITLLYAGFGLLYLLFYEWQNKEKRNAVILSHLVVAILTFVIYRFFIFKEIENIQIAMTYQSSLSFKGLSTLFRFFKQLIEFLSFLPLIAIIPLIMVAELKSERKKTLLLLLFLVLSASIVILQNRFSSPYHYLSFIPTALFALYFLKPEKRVWVHLALTGMIAYVVFQNFNRSTYLEIASNAYYKKFFKQQLLDYNDLHRELESRKVNELLFVSGDSPPYYVREKSAYKECSALIFSRLKTKPALAESARFKDYLSFYLNYGGTYILLDRNSVNLDLPALQPLREKLQSGYKEVFRFSKTPDEYDAGDVSLFEKI